MKTVLPRYYQHVTYPTRGNQSLDHCYTPLKDAYKSVSRPHFGKSDHLSVLLLPVYKPKVKREPPVVREVKCWSAERESELQDCFDIMDW